MTNVLKLFLSPQYAGMDSWTSGVHTSTSRHCCCSRWQWWNALWDTSLTQVHTSQIWCKLDYVSEPVHFWETWNHTWTQTCNFGLEDTFPVWAPPTFSEATNWLVQCYNKVIKTLSLANYYIIVWSSRLWGYRYCSDIYTDQTKWI